MAVYDPVKKVLISDNVLEQVAKRVVGGEEFPNISKDDWQCAAEARAEELYKGSRLTPAQKFSKAIGADSRYERCTVVNGGDELARLFYEASKYAPHAEPKAEKASGGEPGARAEDDEVDLSSPIADRRYGRTISLEEARALGPNAGRTVAMPLRGVGDTRTERQQASRGLAGANPPPGPTPPGPRTRVSVPLAGSGARKSAGEKARAQRAYDSMPGYPAV